jgi:hypothetical protein
MADGTTGCKCHSDGGKRCLCRWWPLLMGPLAMAGVYIAQAVSKEQIAWRGANESMALVIVGISVIGFGLQAIKYKQEFQFFMLALCAAFFCREWHFAGTSNGIYVVLAILAVWFFKRQRQIDGFFKGNAVEVWFWATFSCYALSQIIARRVFRYVGLPGEEEMHIYLEESVETMAHLVMIVTCVVSWFVAARMGRRNEEIDIQKSDETA